MKRILMASLTFTLFITGCQRARDHVNPLDPLGPTIDYEILSYTAQCECAQIGTASTAYYPSCAGVSLFIRSSDAGSGPSNALVKYTLPVEPRPFRVDRADISLSIQSGFENYLVYRLDGPFDGTTTWATLPPATLIATIPRYKVGWASSEQAEVTGTIAEWLNGTRPNYGFMFAPQKGPGDTIFIEGIFTTLKLKYHWL